MTTLNYNAFAQWSKLSTKWKINLLNGRRYLQMMFLIRSSYLKYTKNSYNSMSKNQTTQLKNAQRIWMDIFSKTTYRWSAGAWKDAHHDQSSGKCKSNHNEISSHTCHNGYSQKDHKTSVGEDVEKREPLCTTEGNVNWCGHYGKLYGDSSKN